MVSLTARGRRCSLGPSDRRGSVARIEGSQEIARRRRSSYQSARERNAPAASPAKDRAHEPATDAGWAAWDNAAALCRPDAHRAERLDRRARPCGSDRRRHGARSPGRHQRWTKTRAVSSVTGSRRTTMFVLPPCSRAGSKTVLQAGHRPSSCTLENQLFSTNPADETLY